MIVFAVDPGYRRSALVVYNGSRIIDHRIEDNHDLLSLIDRHQFEHMILDEPVLVLEAMQMFASNRGIGAEVFDSIFWSGMFAHAWLPRRYDRILRSKVRGHLQATKGGDSAVRAALVDRFGPYKEQAIGLKSKPGPLYGIKADEWSALAIAVTWYDLNVAGIASVYSRHEFERDRFGETGDLMRERR